MNALVRQLAQFFGNIAPKKIPVFEARKKTKPPKGRSVTDHARRKLFRPVRVI